MLDVQQALGAAAKPIARPSSSPRRALVVGASGTLGAAVLQQLLATQRFEREIEATVAGLGFEHLSFLRMAQSAPAEHALDAPRRLAHWMLSQLRWRLPRRAQP